MGSDAGGVFKKKASSLFGQNGERGEKKPRGSGRGTREGKFLRRRGSRNLGKGGKKKLGAKISRGNSRGERGTFQRRLSKDDI